MSAPEQIARSADCLRQAVARRDYTGAATAAEHYAAAVAAWVAGLPPEQAAQELRTAAALLEWTRRNLLAARAALADRIRSLHPMAGKTNAPAGRVNPAALHSWHIDA